LSSLAELVTKRTDLSPSEVEHLHRLLESWQLIADLSFADLLLWCGLTDEEGFVCVAQMRPYTAQTLHPEDLFGQMVRPEELPIIERAFSEGRPWHQEEPLLIDGVQVRMEAVPVRTGTRVIAVMTKEGSPLRHRRPGTLEKTYLECAAALTKMVEEGTFPFPDEGGDPEVSPRVGDGLITLDASGRVKYASPNAISAFRRLGIVSTVIGEHLTEFGIDVSPASTALSQGQPAQGEAEVGETIVLQRSVPLISGPKRSVTGAMLLVREVTELRHRERMLQRKEVAIREIHHRVKNNLQTIASLLRLQARRIKSEEARQQLQEAVRRISSIAFVHETLALEESETVEFERVAGELARMISDELTHPDRKLRIMVEGGAGELPGELATPLAVALLELLQNAVKHAFGAAGGNIAVRMSRRGDRLRLVVEDDGKGLPPGFQFDGRGLGLQIVRALVEEELSGTIKLKSERGTKVTLEVPIERRARLRP
jgi:two-component sensor histidine kinase